MSLKKLERETHFRDDLERAEEWNLTRQEKEIMFSNQPENLNKNKQA